MNKTVKRIKNFSVIYFLLVVFFSILVLETEVKEIKGRINQIIPIIFLCIYPFYYFIVMYASRRIKDKKLNEYYEMQFPNINILSNVKEVGFYFFCAYIVGGLICIVFLVLQNYSDFVVAFLNGVHEKIWVKESYSAVISVIVGIYAFLLAFFPIIIADLKDKCMFFEPFELSIVSRSKKITILSLIVGIIYMLLCIIDVKVFWLGAFELFWILLIIVNILIDIWMFTMPVKMEKKVLKKIDRLFCRRKVYITPNKKWWKGNVIRQISILLKDYKKALYKIKEDSIENVEFGCILSKKEENVALAKRRFYRLAIVAIGIMLLFGLTLSVSLDAMQKRLYLIITLLALMPLLIPLLDKGVVENNYMYINRLGYNSTWGYYVKLVNKEKRLYLTAYDLSFSKYRKCLINLKRLVSFYNLALNMRYEDTDAIDDTGIECLCAYITDLSRKNEYKKGMVVPILICACLSENRKKENKVSVKEMLKQIEIDSKEKTMSIEISLQVLRDLYGNDIEFNEKKYETELLELFE